MFKIRWFYYRNEDDVFFHNSLQCAFTPSKQKVHRTRIAWFSVQCRPVHVFAQLSSSRQRSGAVGNMVNNKYFIRRYCSARHGCSGNLCTYDDAGGWACCVGTNKPATVLGATRGG